MPLLGILGLGFGIGFFTVLYLDIHRILREDREWTRERAEIHTHEWEITGEDSPILVLDARKREMARFN